ncbi:MULTISPECIES: helix-turn-helix domain-containing protein [Eubacterium]|jgi:transcriptional regulator with XRE-family HTH domain|uniref:DNA-binding transcriptional regulator, XRE-family HTH domain n=1 Tax=Eubacterium ruminantium TaxID=42322 RepID=A0A1T4Q9U0_9FIRM|nr:MULTISPECIES: helix-turn-helix transcriptional regulator [Eubacterium]MCR5369025.1 helix-turn-helix domain-containing protein [Eubacterium sp.]SCW66382.1 DNA-binding transcriptional regulator, XRE-family HTH domain [Eubacterium ruminantium]SDN33666.1 DNA-binding transcriptional regulator, XRE-family HTH domain [Eubacterium ruminantium]SJZ99968.1 DNA-binding transcriptional regulator, XRE-family HTH domain [Eubacterium ruminantium]
MSFADRLRELRTNNRYSQEQLAEKLCVSRQAISKWETGDSLPDIDKAMAISEFFGVSMDYLLKERESFSEISTDDNMDRAIIKFMASARQMNEISEELVAIAMDGKIDDEEMLRLQEINVTLDSITKIIKNIKEKMGMDM